MVANIRRSSLGRRFLAVRINERAAAAAGINVARTKLLGAALASFLAAVAGVMFAYKSGGSFNGGGLEAQTGLEALALGYLGGVGYVSGAVIGGLLAPSGLAIALITGGTPSTNLFLATGVGLILVTVLLPGGVASLAQRRSSASKP
jgi:ABC-type branched-subunit amino acid transport system permease subunit